MELSNYEIAEYCELNIQTGKKRLSKTKKVPGFTGLYYKNDFCFFAIYPTKYGPEIYYHGKQYVIKKDLAISLSKNGKRRQFTIIEYGIVINYTESPYIGLDVWSDEIDVDLFYMIVQSYKSNSFYEKYTFR